MNFPITEAEKIVSDQNLKRNVKDCIDNFECGEHLRDVIVIFLDEKWIVDACWTNLSNSIMIRVLKALLRSFGSMG